MIGRSYPAGIHVWHHLAIAYLVGPSSIRLDRIVSLDLSFHRRMRIGCNQSRARNLASVPRSFVSPPLPFIPCFFLLPLLPPSFFFLLFRSRGLPPLMTPTRRPRIRRGRDRGGKKKKKKKRKKEWLPLRLKATLNFCNGGSRVRHVNQLSRLCVLRR